MHKAFHYLLTFSLLGTIYAQTSSIPDSLDVAEDKKVKILPVPALGYSPETGFFAGAVCLFTINLYDKADTRTSNAKLEVNYTVNRQLITEGSWNYFFDKDAWFTRGLIGYSKYPDYYYGIGKESDRSDEVRFASNRIYLDADILKKINGQLYVGAGLRFYNYYDVSNFNDTIKYDELSSQSSTGLRLLVTRDTRNNILTTTKGHYQELAISNVIGKQFYAIINLDLRKYYTLGKNENTFLSGRVYHSTVVGKPNFYDYALVGGDKFARGYFFGRYRDLNMTVLQAELRQNIIWRVGGSLFGGVTCIYSKLSTIDKQSFKPNIGVGFRFRVDDQENTNLRLDYAVGVDGQSGFYVSFGESF